MCVYWWCIGTPNQSSTPNYESPSFCVHDQRRTLIDVALLRPFAKAALGICHARQGYQN